MPELDRIRWRCRRGLLELDLVLAAFLQQGYGDLTAGEQASFVRLLDADDNELWDWVAGRLEPTDADLHGIVERLRAVRPSRQAA